MRDRPTILTAAGCLLAATAMLGAGFAAANQPAPKPRLPAEIAAFRAQLWSVKPPGQTFRLVASERVITETARWALAEHPELPFSEPEIKVFPGGLAASGVAELLGQRIRVRGLVRVTLTPEGKPQFAIEELTLGGAETTELFLDAVRSALISVQQSHLDFRGLPLSRPSKATRIRRRSVCGSSSAAPTPRRVRRGLAVHGGEWKLTFYREIDGQQAHLGREDGAGGLDGEDFYAPRVPELRFLRQALAAREAQAGERPPSEKTIPEETLKMLRVLGYVD